MNFLYVSQDTAVAYEYEVKNLASWAEHRILREDRERYKGFTSDSTKHRFALSRQTLYEALAQIDAKDVELAPSRPNRRPEVLSSKDIWVSIAHTPGLVVAAASYINPIGVDVELHDRDLGGLGLVSRCYSEREQYILGTLYGEERRRELLDMWLAKESLSKVIGTGLATDFRELTRDKHCLINFGVRELIYSTQGAYRLCWAVPEYMDY